MLKNPCQANRMPILHKWIIPLFITDCCFIMSRIHTGVIWQSGQQSVQAVPDLAGTSSRKICPSYRAAEQGISAEQNAFLFRNNSSSFLSYVPACGSSGWKIPPLQIPAGHPEIHPGGWSRFPHLVCHIHRRPQHFLFLTTGINRNLIFFPHCLHAHNMIEMTMCEKNCHRPSPIAFTLAFYLGR